MSDTIKITPPTQKKTKPIHLKGLNGLRAIASIAVVVSHITLSLENFGLISTIFGSNTNGSPKGLQLAAYGVSIFFALSGFLITYLLLKEKEKKKDIHIKKFYIRRILRIWPLYYFYILLCFITYYYFQIDYTKKIIPFYIFLMANIPIIINNMLPFLGHFWSIGVEEQFYLFWPWIVKTSSKKILRTSILLFLLLFSLKIIFRLIKQKYNITIPYIAISVTRIHTMILGCIGAILYYKNNRIILLITSKIVQISAWIIIFAVAINKFNISSLISNEVIASITIFIIYAQITRKNFILNLDNKIMNFIGKISYGIYVYHPLIIFFTYKTIGKFKESSIINYILTYTIVISITLLVSYLSYILFESKFIKLKTKFALIKSSA